MGGYKRAFGRYTNLSALFGENPSGAWELSDGATHVASGKGSPLGALFGKELSLATDAIDADAAAGYSVEEGSGGVSQTASGLVVTANDSNPVVRIRLPFAGSQRLWRALNLKIASASASSPGAGVSAPETSTGIAVRCYVDSDVDGTEDDSAAWGEALLAYNGTSWLIYALQTPDEATYFEGSGSAVAIGDLTRLGCEIYLNQDGNPNYPSFLAIADNEWGGVVAATEAAFASQWGFDLGNDTDQGCLWEIVVKRGPSGASITVTLESLVLEMQAGTVPT